MKDISLEDSYKNLPFVTQGKEDYQRPVKAGTAEIGKKQIVVIAGPCTVESKTQIMDIAKHVKQLGAKMLRGGVFKPRTFPRGETLGRPDSDNLNQEWDSQKILSRKETYQAAEIRLGYLKEAGEKYGLPVISEILYIDSLKLMEKYVDMFQMGCRNMFNLDLIETLVATDKPVMIKRDFGESLRSLLGMGEHFEARDKHDFVFCERGIVVPHTHHSSARFIIDIQAIPASKEYAPTVPMFADPSHSTTRSRYVGPISRAAIAAGADGLLIEVHPEPMKAWVDPLNAINYIEFEQLMQEIESIAKILGRSI